jgi:hypothetical protein
MRRVLGLASRTFPRDYRARRSGELVDTALLAADGSAWRTGGEALSLVTAGLRQRARAERGRSVADGIRLLAGVVALVNLSVALAGIGLSIERPPVPRTYTHANWVPPRDFRIFVAELYNLDWWWIAFAIAAASCVVGLVLGNRRLALGAALANLVIVAYDEWRLGAPFHLDRFAYLQGRWAYPTARDWLAPALLLAVTAAAAPLRRLSLTWLPLALVASMVLVALARERYAFFYLRWPLAAIVVVALAFGWFAPRLAVLAVGLSLAVVWPILVDSTLMSLWGLQHPNLVIACALAPLVSLGISLPLARLTRRRLT